MNQKSKKLAKKISNIISDVSNLQETYNKFINIAKRQKVYFLHIEPSDYLKIVFYIWSLKKTNDFILGDNLINKTHFADLFYTENEPFEQECDECYGNGQTSCDNCAGDGSIQCDECGGSGEIDCDECGSSGEDEEGNACRECQGGGKVECSECGGDGTFRCEDCFGNGEVTCSECDGSGEVETDKSKFKTIFICTWDDFIFDRCELTEDRYEPFLSEYDFDRLSDDYIVLSEIESQGEIDSKVKPYEVYCMNLSNISEIKLNGDMQLTPTIQTNLDSYAE